MSIHKQNYDSIMIGHHEQSVQEYVDYWDSSDKSTPTATNACSYANSKHICECTDPSQWKELRDHPKFFLCCDGNVVSFKRQTGPRLLQPYFNHRSQCLSHSFGKNTKSTAKLVLEHFHPSFPETGGRILYKDQNRKNAKLNNLDFVPFEEPGIKSFWDVYYKTRWDRDDVSEEHVKAYFDHILDSNSVADFCEKYNAGIIPQNDELKSILEAGWVEKYGGRRHSHHAIPEGQVRQLLNYLVTRANLLSDKHPQKTVLDTAKNEELTLKAHAEEIESPDKRSSCLHNVEAQNAHQNRHEGMNTVPNSHQNLQMKLETSFDPLQTWKLLQENNLAGKVGELIENFKMNYFLINNIKGKKRQALWEDRNDHIMQSWFEAAQDEVYFEYLDNKKKKQRTDSY